jgi:hypothetical protein
LYWAQNLQKKMPYESGILVCFLVIFWSLANENPIFVAFNKLIDVQNIQFTILQTSAKRCPYFKIEFASFLAFVKKTFCFIII